MRLSLANAFLCAICLTALLAGIAFGQADNASAEQNYPSRDVLNQKQWQGIDQSIDRGLHYLASQQTKDGSFDTEPRAKSAITSLVAMTFLANGHLQGRILAPIMRLAITGQPLS